MSYTEADVIQNIYETIKADLGMVNIINTLIMWYEKERENYKVNEWNTEDIDKKIEILKSKA